MKATRKNVSVVLFIFALSKGHVTCSLPRGKLRRVGTSEHVISQHVCLYTPVSVRGVHRRRSPHVQPSLSPRRSAFLPCPGLVPLCLVAHVDVLPSDCDMIYRSARHVLGVVLTSAAPTQYDMPSANTPFRCNLGLARRSGEILRPKEERWRMLDNFQMNER